MRIRVYDNDGATIDRYTVIIGSSVYGMSSNPLSPLGFNRYCGELSEFPHINDFLGDQKELGEEEIPEQIQRAIKGRMEE